MGFAVFGVFVLRQYAIGELKPSPDEPGLWGLLIASFVGSIFFGGGGILLLVQALKGNPVLVLDDNGWATPGRFGVTIPWECVQSVEIFIHQVPTPTGSTQVRCLAVVPKNLERLLSLGTEKEQRRLRQELKIYGRAGVAQEMRLPKKCEKLMEEISPYIRTRLAEVEEGLPPVQDVVYPRG